MPGTLFPTSLLRIYIPAVAFGVAVQITVQRFTSISHLITVFTAIGWDLGWCGYAWWYDERARRR